mgnify:CR=1 FL=1|jgi:uncharacterized phage protein gp47/JayE
MYEDMTFENIMDRCLDRVSSSIDKREGSVVYDAIAPAAAELAIMYIELAYLMDRAFPDTESGDDLFAKEVSSEHRQPPQFERAILKTETAPLWTYRSERVFLVTI